jgi:hypothetical protein
MPKSSPIHGVGVANNVVEFLGMMVTVWLVIIECAEQGSKQDCILALGDNTSAILAGSTNPAGFFPTRLTTNPYN